MTELLTAAQMRALEQAAIDAGDVTGLELMEHAGRGVVEAVFEEWPNLAQAPHRAIVFCGPGNNGGDGFVVARLLKDWGWEVEVFLYGDPDKLPPDARVNYERWAERGAIRNWDALKPSQVKADLFVDAIFGTGLTRAPSQDIMEPLTALYVSSASFEKLVAIDAPTGLCLDSGKSLSPEFGAVYAWLTVTFHSRKPGHLLQDGPAYCGKTILVDIGLPSSGQTSRSKPIKARGRFESERFVAKEVDVQGVCAFDLKKPAETHKYSHGHAVILSGPPGTGGAARLAARGALRIGAGLVSVVCEAASVPEHAAQLNAIMIKRANGAEDLAALLEDPRLNAIGIGPGLGLERARELVPVALGAAGGHGSSPGREDTAKRRVVLDADALSAYAPAPDDLFAMLHDDCVLTPHTGEFRRLFPDIAEKLGAVPTTGPAYSKLDATREAAARAGCVVLFKGPDTVIAHPDGRASINSAQYERAAPWLATAGSGDVLTGFIAGLLARGFDPMEAAQTAAWLHVECARHFGPGLIAEDLPEQLPAVLRNLKEAD